jgi:hypothetical protein
MTVFAAGTGEAAKAGPLALAVILALCIACYFLFRSMSRHLKKVRQGFPAQAGPDRAGDPAESSPAAPTAPSAPSAPAGPAASGSASAPSAPSAPAGPAASGSASASSATPPELPANRRAERRGQPPG